MLLLIFFSVSVEIHLEAKTAFALIRFPVMTLSHKWVIGKKGLKFRLNISVSVIYGNLCGETCC